MRTLVCFKVISEVEHLNQNELRRLSQGEDVLQFSKRIYSPYDEGALETALVIKSDSELENHTDHVTALTIGQCDPRFLKNLYAVKYDEVIQILADNDLSFSPFVTSEILINYLQNAEPYDAIFMGMQASVGESALVPAIVSKALDIHLIMNVVEVKKDGEYLYALSQTESGKLTMIVQMPIICAFGNASHPYLRVATLKEKILTKDKAIKVIKYDVIPSSPNSFHMERLIYRPLERKGVLLVDGLDNLIRTLATETKEETL